MIVIGPLNNSTNFVLIVLDLDTVTIIHLGFKANLIYVLNDQLPFFHSSYIEKVIDYPLPKLKDNFKTETILKQDLKSFEISKSKIWSHKVLIQTPSKDLKFGVTDREKFNEYQNSINNWLK